MKICFLSFLVSIVALVLFIQVAQLIPVEHPAGRHTDSGSIARIIQAGDIPLYFIPNKGQADPRALYFAKTSRYMLWLTRDGLVFDRACRLVFLNANPNVSLELVDPADYRVNYFIGNDPNSWRTDIATSRGINYKGIYKNIDLYIRGFKREIEYDWIVRPGGDIRDIRFECQGMKNTYLGKNGNLIFETDFGELVHQRPLSYQEIDGQKLAVEVSFRQMECGQYGFFAQRYNPSYALVIDPIVLTYSSFLGGSGDDVSFNVIVDMDGAIYLTGDTDSQDFPVKNAFNPTDNSDTGLDVFITKFSPSGKDLIFSTYLGGSKDETGTDIAVDGTGAIYIAGATQSSNFPLKKALDKTYGGENEDFVTELSPKGNALVYSTYLGGRDWEGDPRLAIDSKGAVYIASTTGSSDFPLKKALFGTFRNEDAFLTKIAPEGKLEFSTFLGGGRADAALNLALDSTGNIYVVGITYSNDFPVKNAFDSKYNGDADGFITKFAPSGAALVYSTYLGGNKRDNIEDIAVNGSNEACITGFTYSKNFPVRNAFDPFFNPSGKADSFVTKLTATGNALRFSTFLGGKERDYGVGIAIDGAGFIYVAGHTESGNFPIKNAFDAGLGGAWDGFVAGFKPAGTLLFSSFLGGKNDDYCLGISTDKSKKIFLSGFTNSADFPEKNAFDKNYNGNKDAFLTILKWSSSASSRILKNN